VLPEGFETAVSKQMEGGIDLSGGQWQRISLARALMRGSESELLVLDEPTAALDPRAAHEILTTLRRMTARKMTLIISHRLALARYVDQIAVMEDGRVVEAGTHRELMESAGPTRRCSPAKRKATSTKGVVGLISPSATSFRFALRVSFATRLDNPNRLCCVLGETQKQAVRGGSGATIRGGQAVVRGLQLSENGPRQGDSSPLRPIFTKNPT
jgi:ABC-type uncharacterized transport system ATPase subunit